MTWRRIKRPRALWLGLQNGLKPRGWIGLAAKKPTRLKPRSRSYASRMTVYRSRVRTFLESHPFCAVFTGQRAIQNHHRFGRRGRLLLWEPGWLAVSQSGQEKIHANLEWAREHGFIGPVGTWNDYGRAVKAMARAATESSGPSKAGRSAASAVANPTRIAGSVTEADSLNRLRFPST